MHTTKPQYLVFISHKKDGHTNTIVNSAIEAWWAIQGILEEEEFTAIKSKLEVDIDALADGQDMYQEFKDGTWTTITRRDIEIPISKIIGVDGRELNAILVGLRQLQEHGYIKEYLNEETPLDNDEIDELCDMLNVVEPTKKQAVLPQSLKDRIRILSEAEAIGHMVCDDELINYDDFMSADNVFKIATIVDIFENYPTESIQEHVDDTASVLEAFATSAINLMSVSDMMEIISQRAVDAGAVDSKGELALLAIKSMVSAEKSGLGHDVSETDEVFVYIEDFDDEYYCSENPEMGEYLHKASEFGISYVNGH
jgi:hypothetical protein